MIVCGVDPGLSSAQTHADVGTETALMTVSCGVPAAKARKKAKAPAVTETQEQLAIVEYLDAVKFDGDVVWTHIRGERAGAYQRILAKKMGVKPKFPDFLFIYKPITLWVEMKRRRFKNKTKFNEHELAQFAMHERLRAQGHYVEICETLEELCYVLLNYNFPLRNESITSERIRRGVLTALNESEQ